MMVSGKQWKSRLTAVVLVVIFGRLTCASVAESMCPRESITESIFGFRDQNSVVLDGRVIATGSPRFFGVNEGDEVFLQKTLSMVNKNGSEYLAVLFYASWCPFSKAFRPNFALLSALYPSILHFAVEESSVKPSTLSKYGVHGFPTLFLLNSTMRVHYHGSRAVGSLVAFYSDVTGFKAASLDKGSLDKIAHSTKQGKKHANDDEQENCPFSWARSPENMLRHETYLALASLFVILRLLYLVYPTLLANIQFIWRRYIQNVRLRSFLDHPHAYLNRGMQLFSSLKQPCKRSNLQEGAMSARAWASKSLTTVSIGEASSSRSVQ